jgi:hypothetical protein
MTVLQSDGLVPKLGIFVIEDKLSNYKFNYRFVRVGNSRYPLCDQFIA